MVSTLLYHPRSTLFFIIRPRWCSPDRSFIYARETGRKSWKLSEFDPSLSKFRISRSFSSSPLFSISFRQYPHVSSLALIYRRLRIKHVYGLSPSCNTFRSLHTCLDLRRIERKAHLPRSFILFPPRVNSRIRESDDVDEICTVHTIKTQWRNYVQKSCDTCTSREDSTFKWEKSNWFKSISATEDSSAAAIVSCRKETSKCQFVL